MPADDPKPIEGKFSQQAFLWDFLDNFKNQVGKKIDTYGYEDTEMSHLNENLEQPTNYKNFIQLNDKDSYAVLNKITGGGACDFDCLSSAQLSSMVPHVQIYKIIKNKEGEERDIQFPFNNFTSVDSIGSSVLDRGIDAGLQSVVWRDVGVNPDDVGRMFEGEMKLFFQSIESIYRCRNVDGHKLSFGDLLDHTESLSNLSSTSLTSTSVADPSFKLKLEVGWSISPTMQLYGDSVKSLRRSYIIDIADQQLNFNTEDGAVVLTLKFAARVETMAMGPIADILYIDPSDPRFGASIVAAQKKKEEALAKNKEAQAIKRRAERGEEERKTWGKGLELDIKVKMTDNEIIEEQNKEIKQYQKKYDAADSESRAASYRRIYNVLRSLPRKAKDTSPGIGRIRYIDINTSIYDQYMKLLTDSLLAQHKSFEDLADVPEKDKQTKIDKIKKKYMKDRSTQWGKISGLVSAASTRAGSKRANPKDLPELPTAQDEENNLSKFCVPLPKENTRLNYFYLGDLMESVLEIIYKRPKVKDNNKVSVDDDAQGKDARQEEIKMILGPFTYINPANGKRYYLQMADIPISLDYFNTWFFNTVVKENISALPLKVFLDRLCGDLMGALMSPERYGPFVSTRPYNTTVQTLWLDKKGSLSTYWNKNKDKPKQRINISKIMEVEKIKKGEEAPAARQKITDFLYLYIVGTENYDLAMIGNDKTRSEFNCERNIPHYFIGGQTNLLKNISFARTKIPSRFETSLDDPNAKTQKNLLFQDKYDANIELFGNPAFKPGMYIYIDPKGLGLGPSVKYTESNEPMSDYKMALSIGGYYRIHRVTNTISDGVFVTQLQTVAELDLRDIDFIKKKNKK